VASGDWWRHGVIYQIYPRSFQDSNGDGIGDLPGITSRLDHLNDGTPGSLGVDAIWLSPFYPSPMVDFGYDVSGYCDVHPDYGTLADFDELLGQAHRRGIRVLVDFVPNHTSDRHPWFLASRSSRDDPHRDWYVWRDPKPDGSPPNNWRSVFRAVGGAWTFDPRTGQYYLHSFLPQQPDLNWWHPAVREAMHAVLRFWLDRGVDGFRIDVAHKMARDPDLRDNPRDPLSREEAGPQRRDEDWPEVHVILREFRKLLDAYDSRMAVGEVAIEEPERLVRYFGERQDELHLAFNFAFLAQPWRAEAFRDCVDRYEQVLPVSAWPTYTLSNHDYSRARSRYDPGDGSATRRARLAAMLLLTLRGTPFLYYGEEIGQADGEVPPNRVVDRDGRDPERTPMQWGPGPGAGFSTGDPWLPVGLEAPKVNVTAQGGDPASILSLYRRLIWYRRGSAALRWGSYRAVGHTPDVFAFVREAGTERLLVALNFRDRRTTLRERDHQLTGSARLVLSTDPERGADVVALSSLELRPTEGVIVRL
jgi:alpha-glucosidase